MIVLSVLIIDLTLPEDHNLCYTQYAKRDIVVRLSDQRLCLRSIGSTMPLLSESEIARFFPASVTVHAGLCQTCTETQIVFFFFLRLKY